MTTKLTDKELNKKLMESMNITDTEARRAFEDLMNAKVKDIRAEVKQEVYEELSKQAKIDKQRIVESLNDITNSVIAEEKKKIDACRKKLIKEKLALKEARENLDKEIIDRTACLKEEYDNKLEQSKSNFNNKLNDSIMSMKKTVDEQKEDFIEKASAFINECVKKEIKEFANDKKQMANGLRQFSKFITEQVAAKVKEHRDEMRSLEELKVRLVKEQKANILEAKKKFYEDAANKSMKFLNECVKNELSEFRTDIAEARKNTFGAKLFEAFSKEYAKNFFNENNVVKGLLKSIKADQNKLKQSNKVLESKQDKLIKENKQLKASNEQLVREKIISESTASLSTDERSMIKNLTKDVETSKLNESIQRYIPMIIKQNIEKNINKDKSKVRERVLNENKGMKVLTGNVKNRTSLSDVFKAKELPSEINKEIEQIIKIAKS